MIKKYLKHFNHYLVLFGVLVAGLFGFFAFSYDRIFQTAIVVAVAASYVAWGVVHHAIHDELEPAIFVEYLLIASLGLVIVFSLILNV